VDLRRTLYSHGFLHLAPNVVDEKHRELTTTLALPSGARKIRLFESAPAALGIEIFGPRPSAAAQREILRSVRTMLALDDDLSIFYAGVAGDPDLAWAARGAGRLFRSPTAFEDVVKTILTTNCAWSATKRMARALVEHLGEGAIGDTSSCAFPSPAAMATAKPEFYRDVVRAGYRGPYLRKLASMVESGEIDVEALRNSDRRALDDAALEKRLRALPGVGPYAAAHVMMLFGRRHRLVLDSSTRPRYARLSGRKAKDATIVRRFSRYRDEAGLAFWLYLSREWLDRAFGSEG
jgi:3-methyladenine DNA glycosylase/8-oxoguanine DNA glycosylase